MYSDLEQAALKFLEREGGATSVLRLYGALLLSDHSVTRRMTTDVVWRLADQDKVELDYVPLATFGAFLRHWQRNLTIYVSFAVALVTILAIYTLPASTPLVVVRWIFGVIFVLFIPGYMATKVLFPKITDLNALEWFALSIGLSLTSTIFVCFLLNYTPWGITMSSLVSSLTLITILLGTVTLVRQYGVFQFRD